MGIIYEMIEANAIHDAYLFGFSRYQETFKVNYIEHGKLLEKEDYFLEDWDNQKLIEVARSCKRIVEKGGKFIVAKKGKDIIGFACLASDLFFEEYLNLDIIQVDAKFRRLGIGKEIFKRVEDEARKLGAKKLYISAHPNIYTQGFYKKLGCVLAKKINKHIVDLEPLDIQLEKDLFQHQLQK